jgi:hypothetical protein
MLQILFGLDARPSSGEGFEQAFADFLAVAVQMAAVTDFSEGDVEALGTHCGCAPPPGWKLPLTLVPWLRALAEGGRRPLAPLSVRVRHAATKMQPGPAKSIADVFKECLGPKSAAEPCESRADVVINAGRAEFADLVLWYRTPEEDRRDVVLLCQTKRYLSSANEVDIVMILDELYKMGCRDEFAVAGHWAAHASADDVVAKAAALGITSTIASMAAKMRAHPAGPKTNPKVSVPPPRDRARHRGAALGPRAGESAQARHRRVPRSRSMPDDCRAHRGGEAAQAVCAYPRRALRLRRHGRRRRDRRQRRASPRADWHRLDGHGSAPSSGRGQRGP